MSQGNGHDAMEEVRRVEHRLNQRVDSVESNVSRIGTIEYDVLRQIAAIAAISRDVSVVNTNVNNLRLSMDHQHNLFREAFERIEKKLGTR